MAKAKSVKQDQPKGSIVLGDGNEYTIKFNLNAMVYLEEQFGSIDEAFKKAEEENSIKAIRGILYSMLMTEHPDLTVEQVGALVDIDTLGEYMDAVGEVVSESMPKEDEVATKKQPTTKVTKIERADLDPNC